MSFDPVLVDRLRVALSSQAGLSERRMFGGIGFLIDGSMAVAASHDGGLLARVNPADSDALCAEPAVERMVMQGKPMNGWLKVEPTALEGPALERWVALAVTYVRTVVNA